MGLYPQRRTVQEFLGAKPVMKILHYRGTSLIRKRLPLGPYSGRMPRGLGWSYGGGRFLMSEVPL